MLNSVQCAGEGDLIAGIIYYGMLIIRGIALEIYLVDGTYELFRHYYALPSARDNDDHEVAAVRGALSSVLGMIKGGATHIAVATDHVIESFRNQLWPGYKTGEGIEPDLWAQFPLLEEVLARCLHRFYSRATTGCGTTQ